MSHLFESVKELYKVHFPILIYTSIGKYKIRKIDFFRRTNLHFLFVVQLVRNNTFQCLSTGKANIKSSFIFKKNQFVITSSTSHHKERRPIWKVVCFLAILWWSRIRVCNPLTSKKKTFLRIGLTIGIGSLWYNLSCRNIRESLLGSAGVVSCPVISNRCTLLLANQQAGSWNPHYWVRDN